MKRVLFSTLGMTDPMKNDYDGPLLHILRHYMPGKVYLFMTKRICELADIDNRYRIYIQRLSEKIGFDCEVVELRYEEIDNPQQFDIFYPLFEKELTKIHQMNPECQILINLSSGTPQMKSACQLISLTTPFPVHSIQVTTPHERENYGPINFDLEHTWENNLDNHPELEIKNRCVEVESKNLRYLFLREAALSHIKAYEYGAALSVLSTVKEFIPVSVLNLLQAAWHRKNMELIKATQLAEASGFDLFPVKSANVLEIFEYLLLLKLQQQKGDLLSFVRGISPALTRLFEALLQEKCRRKIKVRYCVEFGKRGSDHWKLLREKLASDKDLLSHYDSEFNGNFRDSDLSAAALLPMITYDFGPKGLRDSVVVERAVKMREVEEQLRNPAAHSIRAITEEQFMEKTGISSRKLMDYLIWMFEYTYPKYIPQGENPWESYEKMNNEIISRLK